jgi:predicted secreted protein
MARSISASSPSLHKLKRNDTMPSFKGRDLLLKIGDGGGTEIFTAIGSTRATAVSIANAPVPATLMDGQGIEALQVEAGLQSLEIRLEGLFKDAAAEELLRSAAFSPGAGNFQLLFPNGDLYQAAFVVISYERQGDVEGLESFAVTLRRSGAGTFTEA